MQHPSSQPALSTMEGSSRERFAGCCLGWVVEWQETRGLRVDFQGNQGGPVAVVGSTVALDSATLHEAAKARRQVVLLFEGGNPRRPVLVGLMQPLPVTPLLDALLAQPAPPPPPPLEARVDGRRVLLEAEEELELRCGRARVLLRAPGQVTIQGLTVETNAKGLNRIFGGSVEVN